MARLVFTSNLHRHIDCPEAVVQAGSVREALEAVFEENPALRSYIVDDQHRLRTHMVIFVDNVPVRDRDQLTDVVHAESEIYVMQALSGG